MDKKKLKKLLLGRLTLKRFIRSIIFIYTCLFLFAYIYTSRLVLMGRKTYSDTNDIIKVPSGKNIQLSCKYYKGPNSEFTILYSHGNAEDINDLKDLHEMYTLYGYSVFAWDYRGYGTSSGRASEKNICQDILVVYKYMTEELKIPPEKIIPLGRSIGSYPSTYLASKEKVAALILESALTSAYRVMPSVPIFPFDRFRNINIIDDVNCPILFVHGQKDRIIPISHSYKLYKKARPPKLKLWHKTSSHNDLNYISDEHYWLKITELTNLTKPPPY